MAGRGRGRGLGIPIVKIFPQEEDPPQPGVGQEPQEEEEPAPFRPRAPIPGGRGRGRQTVSQWGRAAEGEGQEERPGSTSSDSSVAIPESLQVVSHDAQISRLQARGRGVIIDLGGRTLQPGEVGESRPGSSSSGGRREAPAGAVAGQFMGGLEGNLSEMSSLSLDGSSVVSEASTKGSEGSERRQPRDGTRQGQPPAAAAGSERFFGAGGAKSEVSGTTRSSLSGTDAPESIPEEQVAQEPIRPIGRSVLAPPERQPPIDPIIRRGVKGTKIPVLTNFLKLRVKEGRTLCEYKVQFDPVIDGMSVRRRAIVQLESVLGKAKNFDGSLLFLPYKIAENVVVYETPHPGDESITLRVQLEYSKQLDLMESSYFYNVLFRRALEGMNYVEISGKHYDSTRVIYMKEHKLEIWPGYTTAVQVFEGGLMVCVNSAHRLLRQTTLLDYLNENRRDQAWKAKFIDYVVGRTVMTRYNHHTYKIDDVDWTSTPLSTFNRKGKETTFADYFSQHHEVHIRDLRQPLVVSKVKPKKNDPTGEERLIMLVPETCYLTGMSDDVSSNNQVMREIIGHAAMVPEVRLRELQRFIDGLQSEKVKELFDAWGLEVRPRASEVEGRLMSGPSLYFSERFSLKTASGDFSREATTNRCFNPIQLKRWMIFCGPQDRDKATQVLQNYKQVIGQLGITMTEDPQIFPVRASGRFPSANDFKTVLKEKVEASKVQFVVVILPQARDELYAAVKRHCLVDNCIPSQVILAKTLMNERRLRSVMQKIALQINAKLGGALWALNIPIPDTIMFVGMDTHHDPKRKNKSVFALVATMDARCTQYYSRVVLQTPHQESGDAAKQVFTQALAAFFETNSAYPDRIMVFRDGISDGQLPFIKKLEVDPLKETVNLLCRDKPVKFTYVVVQKRINERIFALNRGKPENPQPGTVVDNTITRRDLYDFFLVSQLVRQGTVTPSHYIVMDDSDENNPDLVQKLTFVLSFMYFNWPGAIRGPAPCQYAHKLAMLVGQHLGHEPKNEMEKKLYYL